MDNLNYFMNPKARETEIVEIKGVKTYCDEAGNPVPIKIKMLTVEEMDKLRAVYRTRAIARDKKGNSIVSNGELVHNSQYDAEKAGLRIIAEALVQPDLHATELQDYYNCFDLTDMVKKVFFKQADFTYVQGKVAEVLGLIEAEKNDEEVIEKAKN